MLKYDREKIDYIKELYPVGCRVELVEMDDVQAPPIGTEGEVSFIDDTGTIHVHWDNGSSLGVIFGVDEIRKI